MTVTYLQKKFVAPALVTAPPVYDQRREDQLTYQLRLYFNLLDNFLAALANSQGGANLAFPNGAFHQDGYTTLSSSITNTSTTPIQVASTAGFLPSGAIQIGTELIKYTGITSTTFTGITRGAYGSTNASHTAGVYVAEVQPVPSSTTALTVSFTATDVSNQVEIDPLDQTKVIHNIPGYYNIQFSIQLISHDNTIDDVTLWFRQNGTDVPYSAGYVSVPSTHGGVAGAAIISWNLVLPLNAGDYIQLLMSSTTGNTVAATYPPATAPVRPASPSIILTSTFVSALY